MGNGTAYAIKMKGNGNVNRTAYRYRLVGTEGEDNYHMVVEAIYLGPTSPEAININTVADPNFWATHTSEIVSREFWTAGYNSSNKRGSFGYFWSATQNGLGYAVHMDCNSRYASVNSRNGYSYRFSVRLFESNGTTPLPPTYTAPAVTSVTQKQSNWTANVNPKTITTQNNNTQINVKSTVNYLVLKVDGGNAYSNATVTSTSTPWATINNNATTPPDGNTLRVQVQPNTTNASRTATIEITNANDTSKKVEVTITQEASQVNPNLVLAKVAQYNLAPNGTSFMTTHEYNNKSKPQGYFTWNEAMNHAQSMSGYHLPTKEEWNAIFPYNNFLIDFIDARSFDNVDENITIDGATQTYKADYKGDSNRKKAYAIKMKNTNGNGYTQHTTAYRYRLEGRMGGNNHRMIVDAVYLGPTSSETINTVANPSFWTTHASEVVSREFWAAGDGGSSNQGFHGSFWAASQDNSSNAWRIYFNFGGAYVGGYGNDQSYRFSVRLFAD